MDLQAPDVGFAGEFRKCAGVAGVVPVEFLRRGLVM